MTSGAEWGRLRREALRRRALTKELVARKTRRLEAERRERVARESAAWAVKNHLKPERVFEPQPQFVLPAGFGGLRPGPRPEDEARRARRANRVLAQIRGTKAVERSADRASQPEPQPTRLVRTSGQVLDVY